ncbi:MAG: hypothetical protein KDI06_16795 [Calditrichaeota bacterium]|nr:hypothetical protein [Calditrichota bacterium]
MSRILKKKNIAIQSVAVFVDSARLVVSDPEAALRKLQEHGYSAELRAVLQANVPNKRGILADMTQKLGNAGVNIKYLYCSLHDRQRKGVIIMEVDKPEFALKLFRNHQFE